MPTLRSMYHGQRTAIVSRVERDAMLVHVLNDGKVTMLRSDVNGLIALRGGLVERQAIFVRIRKHVEMALRGSGNNRRIVPRRIVRGTHPFQDVEVTIHGKSMTPP